jgi:hypothetical protein
MYWNEQLPDFCDSALPIHVRRTAMSNVQVVGLDIAKNVFHVHAADNAGRPKLR